MKHNPRASSAVLIFLAAALMVLSTALTSQGQTGAARIDGFIKHTGYEFTHPAPGGWGIKRPSGLVIIAITDDDVIIGMVVAQKAKFALTAESAGEMLRLADRLDYIKVGLDDDGDLFVRAEIKFETMTQADFDDVLKRVIKGADDATAKIRPYLIK